MPLVQPAPAFNFVITLWDVPDPVLFGDAVDAGDALGSALGGAAASLAGQFLTGAFSECQGLNAAFEVETYQEGGRNAAPRKFITRGKYENLVLKRGITFSADLWAWGNQIARGDRGRPMVRKSGMIVLLDRGSPVAGRASATRVGGDPATVVPDVARAGASAAAGLAKLPVAAWTFDNGVPERMVGPTLNAKTNEIAIETLEISHEGLARVTPDMIPGIGDLTAALTVGVAVGG